MEHRPELDGIRAIAVIAVVAFHSYVVIGLFGGGWLGVDVFFVLSGYLITSILLREHARTEAIDLRSFWVRRLLRLYPALLVALIAGFAFHTDLDGDGLLGYLKSAASAGLYVENFIGGFGIRELGGLGHTWSLAVEMQFYLVWPPVLVWMLRRKVALLPWVAGAVAVSYVLLALESGFPGPGRLPVGYYMPWTRAFELLLGALVAVLVASTGKRGGAPAAPPRWLGWLLFLGLGGVFLIAATYSILTIAHVLAWEAPLAALLTAGLLWYVERARATGVGALLAWAPLAWIGKVSYAIYLFHYPVLMVLRHHGVGVHHGSTTFVVGLGISIVLAAISYRFVERPALRLKDRFEPQLIV